MTKTFRIYPVRQDDMWRLDKSAWFEVNVFPDRKSFVKHTKLKDALASTRATQGIIFRNIFNGILGRGSSVDKIKKTLFPKGRIGEMNFIQSELHDAVLTHESVHAMFRVVSLYTDILHLWLHEEMMPESEEFMCFLVASFKKQIEEKL